MRAAFTLGVSGLERRWRAWAAIALVIALTGGVVLMTAAGARRTDTSYARFLRTSRGADALVAPFVSPDNPGAAGFYEAVGRLPDVATMAPLMGVSAVDTGRGNAAVQMVAGADARLGRAIERPKITAGRMFRPDRAEEAVAAPVLARRLRLHVGSRLNLLAGPTTPAGFDFDRAKPVVLRVVGIGVTRDDVVAVNAQAAQPALIVTPALFNRLSTEFASREDFVSYAGAYVRLRAGSSVATLGQRAQALATQYLGSGSQLFVADEHQQATKVDRALRPQAVALALFALLVALTGLFVTGQLLSRQLFVSSTEHPTLRALGMTRTELVALGLGQTALAAGVGAVGAVIMAALASGLMPIGPARVAEPHPGVAPNWGLLGLGALAIVAFSVLRTAWPAWRLASAVTGERLPPPERASRLAHAATRAGLPASAAMGVKLALEPGRGQTAVPVRSAVAGTALAVAAVAMAMTFGTNLVRLVDTPRLYGQSWDLAVDAQFGTIIPERLDQFLGQQPGVTGWTFGNHHVATIAGRDIPTIGLAPGAGPVSLPTLLEGRQPQAPDEIVLGSSTIKATGVGLGRTIAVGIQGEDSPRTMRVVGRAVFPFFGQGSFNPTGLGEGAAILDPPPSPDGVNFFLVRMAHGPAQKANIATLERNAAATGQCPSDQDCGVVTAQRPADVRNYARIQATPLALAAVLAVLAAATVAHVLVTSIRRRRRDFAVLKTLGFVRRQVSATVVWQASVLVVMALAVGLPMGVAAGRWTWQYFASRLGMATDARVPTLTLLASVPIALLVANLVAAGPAWVAGRLQPGPVLRSE